MDKSKFPLKISAFKINQQIGDFYAVVLPASLVAKVTFSYPAQYYENILTGTQRKIKEERISQICKYVGTEKATFPNTIILGANYTKHGDFIDDEEIRWKIEKEGSDYKLIIPTDEEVASVIDGQHRLEGIKKYLKEGPNNKDIDLLCTIFIDIPSPNQAEIFATINYTQQQVDKSLAYQLFGYKLEKTKSDQWAPETLAVYLSRVLNTENESPFHSRIKTGLYETTKTTSKDWSVSTAAVVEGITKLISSNPIEDRYKMNNISWFGSGRKVLKDVASKAPLRSMYIDNNDVGIYQIIIHFFCAVKKLFWGKENNVFITKTIGILASFDVLRHVLLCQENPDYSEKNFSQLLETGSIIDFSDNFFHASGSGRSRIRNILIYTLNINTKSHKDVISKFKEHDVVEYKRLLNLD